MEESKTCKSCKQIKSLDLFYTDKGKPTSNCKECVKERARLWRETNKQRHRDYAKQWRLDNPERNKAARHEYQIENRERLVDIVRQRRLINPDERKKYDLTYQRKHKAKVQRWNHERRSRLRAVDYFKITDKEMNKLTAGRCFYCGSDAQVEIDHVIPLSRGGRNAIGNLLSACRSCNASKNNKTIMEWRLKRNL